MKCIGVAMDGRVAVEMAIDLDVDVVLMNVAMPEIDGIEAARLIKSVRPMVSVIAMSAYDYKHYVLACLRVGVDGYLMKNVSRSELINAIRAVHGGEAVFSLEGVMQHMRCLASIDKQILAIAFNLHPREFEILGLMASGMSNKCISRKLNISYSTVATHLTSVFQKLDVQSRSEAIVRALREGLVNLDDLTVSKSADRTEDSVL